MFRHPRRRTGIPVGRHNRGCRLPGQVQVIHGLQDLVYVDLGHEGPMDSVHGEIALPGYLGDHFGPHERIELLGEFLDKLQLVPVLGHQFATGRMRRRPAVNPHIVVVLPAGFYAGGDVPLSRLRGCFQHSRRGPVGKQRHRFSICGRSRKSELIPRNAPDAPDSHSL